MRIIALAAIAALTFAAPAFAQTYGPNTTFKEMMADPRARSILDTHIPLVMTVFDAGSGQPETSTLKSVSENEMAQSQGGFSPEAYARILKELQALSPPAATAPKFGPDSTFAQLAASPAARAIFDRHTPIVMMAFDMEIFPGTATLKQVADSPDAQTGAGLTPGVYQQILADLAKL